MTWPRNYDPISCGCRQFCGDLPEHDDDQDAVCKELPSAPKTPPVEVVVVSRSFRETNAPKET